MEKSLVHFIFILDFFFFIASHGSPPYYDLQYRTSDFFGVYVAYKLFHRHDGVMKRQYCNPWCFKFIFFLLIILLQLNRDLALIIRF